METQITTPRPLSQKAMNRVNFYRRKYHLDPIQEGELAHFDLWEKYADKQQIFEDFLRTRTDLKMEDAETGLKAGDIIRIIAGHDANMVYTVEVLAFSPANGIHLRWDSFWAPIGRMRVLDTVKDWPPPSNRE